MKKILTTEFGSSIYGTSVPSSDKDYKSIFIPDATDLVLQRAPRHIQQNTKKDPNARNTSEDIDHEMFSVQAYCKLLAEGQTPALDILFCPERFYQPLSNGDHSHEFWRMIKDNKDIFLHKGVNAFIGYTKQQAAKYGIKGFRISALETTLDWLKSQSEDLKLYGLDVPTWVNSVKNEHILMTECKGANGQMEPHLQVCERKIPLHATVKYAKSIFQKIYDNYGHRARLAQTNQGVDWKAMYHAVRVSHQVEELLLSHTITFPRPEKELLLKIRKGEMPYQEVAQIIESRLAMVDTWIQQSTLPSEPDYDRIDDLVFEIYRDELRSIL